MIITRDVSGFQEQNKIFTDKEPNIYKRVFALAQDIKQRIKYEYALDEDKRREYNIAQYSKQHNT